MNQSPTTPKPPEWIARNERALARWNSLWPTLDRTRIIPQMHGDTVAAYCQSYAEWRDAIEKVATLGAVVKDHNNRVVPSPYVDIRDKALRQMTELGNTLGIKPNNPLAPIHRYEDIMPLLLADPEAAEA